jgi:hypothetical protein
MGQILNKLAKAIGIMSLGLLQYLLLTVNILLHLLRTNEAAKLYFSLDSLIDMFLSSTMRQATPLLICSSEQLARNSALIIILNLLI